MEFIAEFFRQIAEDYPRWNFIWMYQPVQQGKILSGKIECDDEMRLFLKRMQLFAASHAGGEPPSSAVALGGGMGGEDASAGSAAGLQDLSPALEPALYDCVGVMLHSGSAQVRVTSMEPPPHPHGGPPLTVAA